MGTRRRIVVAAMLALALVAGVSCTAPPEQTAEAVGRGLGFVVAIAIATAICEVNPSCESPICVFFPCAPTPSTPATSGAPESLAPL